MKLVVVSGVSGSGKSTALHVLEDLEYYCIDNLPVGLLPAFAEQINTMPNETVTHSAVGIDARNLPEQLHRFAYIYDQLKNKGVIVEIVFLDADNNILLKRFSETRRKHPLTQDSNTPLIDAIKQERDVLEPISSRADLYIDTSRSNVHELRALIKQRLAEDSGSNLSLQFQSFGFKHGVPTDADFVFDTRCLPNPHWEPSLREFTGLDKPVVDFLQQQPAVNNMFNQIHDFMHNWIPDFEAENRSYLTIAIGCTGGQHRSVYLAHRLAETFRELRDNVSERHRDLV